MALLAAERDVSRATAFRLIKLFRAGGTVMSLVECKPGRPNGRRMLDDRQEEIIRASINRYYLDKNRPGVSQLFRGVQMCLRHGRAQTTSALKGEQLLDDEAELGMQNWMPPSEVARLLLMRRIPRPLPDHYEPSNYRVLGVIVPDLDDVSGCKVANFRREQVRSFRCT